jgi:hypothetical protein
MQLATGADTGYSLTGYVPVPATWTSVTGVRHTGEVMARRRLAAWDADWLVTAPARNRQSW